MFTWRHSHRLHCQPQAEPSGHGQGNRDVAARARQLSSRHAPTVCRRTSACRRIWPRTTRRRSSISSSATRSPPPAPTAAHSSSRPARAPWAPFRASPTSFTSSSPTCRAAAASLPTRLVSERVPAGRGACAVAASDSERQSYCSTSNGDPVIRHAPLFTWQLYRYHVLFCFSGECALSFYRRCYLMAYLHVFVVLNDRV